MTFLSNASSQLRHLKTVALAAIGLTVAGSAIGASTADAKERYAVVIANKNYRHTGEVRFADRDALAIENALSNTMGVPRRNIFKYENASMADLRFLFGEAGRPGQLANLVSGADSELYVYFAGHGSKEADKNLKRAVPYLLGVDSRPERLKDTAFSLDVMVNQLNELQATKLSKGRVMLVLESCFSGRSNDGDLVKDRSAPAFGPPIVLSKRAPKTNENFIMLAAAQGDQYAVWDQNYQRSIFTDAFVSGLYGEADDKRFSGNNDGAVTLSELESFMSQRMARRLRAMKPGERQDPDVMGGRADMTLVKTDELQSEWSEIVRRSHGEKIKSALLMSSGKTDEIESYLTDCLYCPNRKELSSKVRAAKRLSTICEIEKDMVTELLARGTANSIKSYLGVSQCPTHAPKLKTRLAALGESVPTETSSDATDNTTVIASTETDGSTDGSAEAKKQSRLLARRLQSELKRVGCLYGRVDGLWGRGSNRALNRFIKASKTEITGDVPSEAAIAIVQGKTARVCKAVAKVRKKPKVRTKAKRKTRRKKKETVIYEEVYEPAPKKKKSRRKKKTYTETYTAPKKTYKAPKKKYRKKKSYDDDGTYKPYKKKGGGGVYIENLCTKYGDYCG